MTKHLKEAINDRTITINHHDYLLSEYGDSKNYKVDIIPDYYIFEEGMSCDCTVDCYDYGDKASSPYTNMIGVHYKVWITPSGKTKAKLVLDETELIDKDDFDYLDDSVFVMICEWIDNHYGKELFESKTSARKSIKESDDNWYKLKVLNEMLDAMEKDEYNIPTVGIYGVTKNIDLDEGAIRALIKYYK